MVTLNNIEEEFRIINSNYAGITNLTENSKCICISGSISLIDRNGWDWGSYQIEIRVPKTYPKDLPLLVETGGNIERNIDWHISKEGVCCVGTEARQYRDMADGLSLIKWIELFVIPYLANHAYKKDKQYYVDGELAHGEPGLFQDYASCFGLKEPCEVIQRLQYILKYDKLSLNSSCFCESGKKYKRCFLKNYNAHRLGIPVQVLKNDLKRLQLFYSLSTS